jgi:hypothetical protein
MDEDADYMALARAVIAGACRGTDAKRFLYSKTCLFWMAVAGIEHPERVRDEILRRMEKQAVRYMKKVFAADTEQAAHGHEGQEEPDNTGSE